MKGSILTRLLLAASSAAVVAAIVFALLLAAIQQERDAAFELSDAEVAVAEAVELERLVIDVETGLRGFLVTGQARFLEPALEAQSRYPAVVDALRDRTGGTRGEVDALAVRIEAYAAGWFERTVALGRRDLEAARRLVATGEGKRQTDTLRAQFDRLVAAERARARQARERAEHVADRATAIGIGGGIAAIAFMLALAIYLARSFGLPIRRVATAAGRLADGDLTARLSPRAERAPGEVGELARDFNRMASALQESRSRLESQNAELAMQRESLAESAGELEAQRSQLELAVGQLADEKDRLEILQRFGELIVEETRIETLAAGMLREVCDALDADVGMLYSADPEQPDLLRLVALRGVERSTLPAVLAANVGLAGRAAAEQRTVEASHGTAAVRLPSFGREIALRHELHVPLLQAGATVGTITLARAGDAPFSQPERDLLDSLAAQGAVALANALAVSQVRRRETVNAAVLEATPDAIALYGADAEPLLMNGPMRRLVAELGDAASALVTETGDDATRDELDAGERRFERYCTVVRDAAAASVGRLIVLRDVTAEREAERLKDEFFALVSHELRTPLTAILGYIDLLVEDEDAAAAADDAAAQTRRRYLAIVERNARRLLRLVGDLLFVAQVEAGRLNLERGEVRLAELVRNSVDAARPTAEAAGVDLQFTGDSPSPTSGDPDRLAQALDNVISNALKFTPAGGIVTVHLQSHGDRAAIEIADTGHGIPGEELDHVFERFFRARAATDVAVPGAGLGLAIVKAIVEGHGGTVSVESRAGEGTTFRIQIPLVPPAPAGTGAPTQEVLGDHRT